MNNKILVAGLISGMSMSVAQAASVTKSFSLGHATTELTSTAAPGTLSIGTFDQFDSSLGTLTSVDVSLAGESISSTTLSNSASAAQRFRFVSTLDWLFEILDGDDALDFAFTTSLADTGGFISLGVDESVALGPNTDNGIYNVTLTGSDLAQFIGAGSVGIGCNTFTSSTFTGGGGNIVNDQQTTAACSGDITYNFDTPTVNVPEPTTLALLGLGLISFGFRRKV